ncbi:MAG: Fe-S protein assembly co-chaperone HscB, partial [Gallionella sp.]|nr:Fe-S protein assembly co-chaperone HscB [Gallionella sp.]
MPNFMVSDFEKNHFELFGLAPGYQLDLTQLEQSYHNIQAQVHPDKHVHLGDVERRLAMQWATHTNEAYQALRQPLSRARYLLQLHGVAGGEESNTAMSPAFLMEQMEWREAIGEAKAA